jgi:type I restriction enzyme S subunit
MAWEKVKLGDVCKIGDGAHASLKRLSQGIPYLTAKNLTRNGIDVQNLDFIDEITYNKHFKESSTALTRPQKDDILYSIIGSIGGMYLVKDEKIGISSSVAIFRSNPSILISKYLYYYLKSSLFDSQIQAIKGGVAQGFMSLSKLSSIEISYPLEIKTQKRIADILSAYDNLIENNQKQIKLLEEAAQRLYKQWFIDLRYPGHETTKIVDGLPEGWRKDTVDSIVSLLSGFAFKNNSFSENGVFKIVTIKNVQDGIFDGENVSLIDEIPAKMSEHCILNSGDILLSLTGNVGRVCMVVGENYLLNQRVAKLKSDYPSFTYCLFRSKDMFDEMNNLANGAAQQNLSPIRTGQIKITVPSADILKMFENRISPLISRMLILWKQNKYLIQFRNRLLPKLMNGEILA